MVLALLCLSVSAAEGFATPEVEQAAPPSDPPTGRLTGELLLPESSSAAIPSFLTATLRKPGSGQPEEAPIECPTAKADWTCDLPVGTWDLRIEAAGFAPLFLRALEIGDDSSYDVGAFRLTPGFSLEGWVTVPGQREDVRVEAVRITSGAPTGRLDRGQEALTTWSAVADTRGQFRFEGLPSGRYAVVAVSGDLRSPAVQQVIGPPEINHRLNVPLDLQTGTELRLTLEPPLDPWGEPWKVAILASTSDPTVLRTAVESTAFDDGSWSDASLPRGDYALQIQDSREGAWHHQELRLVEGVEERFIVLDVVPVRGSIRFPGDPPSAATIRFSGPEGRLDMEIDEAGDFAGSLPAEQRYEIEVRSREGIVALGPVDVFRRPGKSHVELDFSLPNTVLKGVVTEDGKGIEALVFALPGDPDLGDGKEAMRIGATLRSDDQGRFEAHGVPPGRFRVMAKRGDHASDWTHLELVEDGEVELELRLKALRQVTGRTTIDGQPLAGVKILAQAAGDFPVTATSSLDGSFTLTTSDDARHLDLLLVPPIGALTFRRLYLDPAREPARQVELVISRQSGDLVIVDASQPIVFFRDGVGYSFDHLASLLIFSRINAHPEVGMAISGVETGPWWICPTYRFAASECEELLVLPGAETRVEHAGRRAMTGAIAKGASR